MGDDDLISERGEAILTPTLGVDPLDALATSMHAAPGVYAWLVGSGMSTAAGLPTGWGVVQRLIERIALSQGVLSEDLGPSLDEWWREHGGGEPRFDSLLQALAPTAAMRRALLRTFFDPPVAQGGPIRPTPGHIALAELCSQGRVRVIVTTNFDRLIERALEEAGLAPQVLSRPEEVAGMTPLHHAQVTVVKLHGDYLNSPVLATPDELLTYARPWRSLLRRIFDEYGLVVVGWSAEYDLALASAIRQNVRRRYPAYWVRHEGRITEPGRRLADARQAWYIDVSSADELLGDLRQRLQRLDMVASRHGVARRLGVPRFAPDAYYPPPGWKEVPLLVLRAAAGVAIPQGSDIGDIEPPERSDLVQALSRSAIMKHLRLAATYRPARSVDAVPDGPRDQSILRHGWELITNGRQSGSHAAYQVGGDGTSGVSAIATVHLPDRWQLEAQACIMQITVDVGISIEGMLELDWPAVVLRDSLVLATGPMRDAVTRIVPLQAALEVVELHMLAGTNAGPQVFRENNLSRRLALATFGVSAQEVGTSMSYPVQVPDRLTERPAADLVIDAFKSMALANGFTNPTRGLERLRKTLSSV